MRRLTVTPLLATALLLVFAATAAARTPLHETDVFPYEGSSSCGGFNDDFAGTTVVHVTVFQDAAGNDRVEHDKIMTTETDTNSRTGKSVRVKQAYTLVVDLRTGRYSFNGMVYMGTGSSGAHAIHDTGKVTFGPDGNLLKLAGPHTVLSGGLQPFCQALR
jgi:hypothetical protein